MFFFQSGDLTISLGPGTYFLSKLSQVVLATPQTRHKSSAFSPRVDAEPSSPSVTGKRELWKQRLLK